MHANIIYQHGYQNKDGKEQQQQQQQQEQELFGISFIKSLFPQDK